MSAIELFAGAGGLAVGAHNAGFSHTALVESDRNAAATLRGNSSRVLGISSASVLEADVRDVDFSEWRGGVDLLTAGPPCQPFSRAGKAHGDVDPRNMFPETIRAIGEILPRAFLIENVAGLARPRFSRYLAYLQACLSFPRVWRPGSRDWERELERLGRVNSAAVSGAERYNVLSCVVDAADFGVPQRRARLLIVGYRADLGIVPAAPAATHSLHALLFEQFASGEYWRRHQTPPDERHLGPKLSRALEETFSELFSARALRPWLTVRDAISDLQKPVPRGATPVIANHVQHPGARAYRGHEGSWYDLPAKTLKAGSHGTPGGENTVIDPVSERVRYFTTREAARIQTFPDTWEFHGAWGATIRQLGNAVPVTLAEAFATEIHTRLSVRIVERSTRRERELRRA